MNGVFFQEKCGALTPELSFVGCLPDDYAFEICILITYKENHDKELKDL